MGHTGLILTEWCALLSNVTTKGFEIIINKLATEDLKFNRLASPAKDAKISTSSASAQLRRGQRVEDKETQTQRPPLPAKRPPRRARLFRFLRKFKVSLLVLLVLILAITAAVFFYGKYRDSQNKLKHPDVLAKAETQSLVDKVGKHVELPTGEQPTVATVSDVSKLSNQTFFAGAKNGDKVLIYTKAKKAILYRPGDDKVINFAPLNVNNNQQ